MLPKYVKTWIDVYILISVTLFSAWAYSDIDKSIKNEMISSEINFVGYAYSMDSSDLLYSEHHAISLSVDKKRVNSSVQYKSPTGKLIADKTLIYDETGYFPSFNFVDIRTGQILNVENTGKRINISQGAGVDDNLQKESLGLLKNKTMIADAGFDVFMMKNWSTLILGKNQLVEFLAPTRNMFVTFEIKQTFITDSVVGFSLAPDNFFISLLVDPIYLEYDLESGQILSYKGLTNVEQVLDGKSTGENYIAHIKYQYPDAGSQLSSKKIIEKE